jgi:hypothetical protein
MYQSVPGPSHVGIHVELRCTSIGIHPPFHAGDCFDLCTNIVSAGIPALPLAYQQDAQSCPSHVLLKRASFTFPSCPR